MGKKNWRLSWMFVDHPKLTTPHRANRQFRDFPTRDEAEREKRLLVAIHGKRVVACVQARYQTRRERERRLSEQQQSLFPGELPLQPRPPVPGMPES